MQLTDRFACLRRVNLVLLILVVFLCSFTSQALMLSSFHRKFVQSIPLKLVVSPQSYQSAFNRYKTSLDRKMSSSILSICQRDSYAKISRNRVVACSPSAVIANEFEVVLDDSVLYPEGGGQPSDLGTVNNIPVSNVEKYSGAENPGTFVKITMPAAVEVGSEVECVVDWNRRFDLMQQHTAQHLLSGAACKLYGIETVGWSLGSEYVTVDLQLPGGGLMSEEQINNLEAFVNSEIRRGASVDYVIMSRDELASGIVQQESSSDIAIRGAPKGAALELESLRLVCIAGLDANPCGGTHVRSVAELQLLKIIGMDRERDASRVKFLAGGRAISHLTTSLARDAALSVSLSVPPKLFVGTVEKIMTERADNSKKMKEMQLELAALLGKSIAENFLSSSEDKKVLMFHRHGVDVQFLLAVADSTAAALDTLDPSKPPRFLFFSGDELLVAAADSGKKDKKKGSSSSSSAKVVSPIASPVPGPFVLYGVADKVNSAKDAICTAIAGRGGGRPGKLQGQATAISVDSLAVVKQLLESQLN